MTSGYTAAASDNSTDALPHVCASGLLPPGAHGTPGAHGAPGAPPREHVGPRSTATRSTWGPRALPPGARGAPEHCRREHMGPQEDRRQEHVGPRSTTQSTQGLCSGLTRLSSEVNGAAASSELLSCSQLPHLLLLLLLSHFSRVRLCATP